MSVNNAIFLVDIYMSRLENDTKSYKMFRRSKILFLSHPLLFFPKLARISIIHITERKHSKLITILKFITRIDNIFVVQSFFLS